MLEMIVKRLKLFETLKSLKEKEGYRYCVISDMKVANELLGNIFLILKFLFLPKFVFE